MEKNLLGVAKFLLENNCDCQYHDKKLVLTKDKLKIEIGSDNHYPLEYLDISIRVRDEYITQLVPSIKAKELLLGIWKNIEKQANAEHIRKYGEEKYQIIHDGFVTALNDIDENQYFKFSHSNNYQSLDIKLIEKSSGAIFTTSIPHDQSYGYSVFKIHGALNISIKDHERSFLNNMKVIIPRIILNENKLFCMSATKYDNESIFDYLLSKAQGTDVEKILTSFELNLDLPENNKITKKIKL